MGNIKAEEAMRELTLMLLYLSRFTQREKFHEATDFYAWKGYDFDILDDADYIRQGNHPSRSKSVYITESGMEQAKELFDVLRELDDIGAKKVYARCPNKDGVGLAVYNRLLRAAGFQVVKL